MAEVQHHNMHPDDIRMSDSPTATERRGLIMQVVGGTFLIFAAAVLIFVFADRRAGGSSLTIILFVLGVAGLVIALAGTVIRRRGQDIETMDQD